MPLVSLVSPGRVLILLGNLAYSIGAFAADYNATHVFNPKWPPHAKFVKSMSERVLNEIDGLQAAASIAETLHAPLVFKMFHNGQTMTMGVLLASLSGYFLIRSASENKAEAKDNLFLAATTGTLYCLAGLSAILYPGTAWIDPEFVSKDGATQKPVFFGIVCLMWIGYGIDAWRIG